MEISQAPEPEMAPLFGTTVTRDVPAVGAYDRHVAMTAARGVVDVVSPYVAKPKPAEKLDNVPDHVPAPTPSFGRR